MKIAKVIFLYVNCLLFITPFCDLTLAQIKYREENAEYVKVLSGEERINTDPWSEKGRTKIRINNKNEMLLLDSYSPPIYIYNNLKYVKKILNRGSRPNQFGRATSMNIDERNNIYISAFGNKIVVYNKDGKYLNTILTPSYPHDVVSDSKGKIFVIIPTQDSLVTAYDDKGNYLFSFGKPIDVESLKKPPFYAESSTFRNSLNESIITVDKMGNIYLCFKYKPIIRKYDNLGRLMCERKLDAPIVQKYLKEEENPKKSYYIPYFTDIIFNEDKLIASGSKAIYYLSRDDLSTIKILNLSPEHNDDKLFNIQSIAADKINGTIYFSHLQTGDIFKIINNH